MRRRSSIIDPNDINDASYSKNEDILHDFWVYAAYYGEDVARQQYGLWSPPVDSLPPKDYESWKLAYANDTTNELNQNDNPNNNNNININSMIINTNDSAFEELKKQKKIAKKTVKKSELEMLFTPVADELNDKFLQK